MSRLLYFWTASQLVLWCVISGVPDQPMSDGAPMLRACVASTNPVKLNAVKQALTGVPYA